ncbi:AMP-binding protein [Micromonospora haikouensis]|uniref:AMP-binding protein n=1 Tax=Micromonospora haikouensis TaxID=686309 RepID=UPI0037A905D5
MRLDDWFRRGLAVNPSGVALQVAGRQWTYTETDRLARRCAATLRAAGRPRRVALLAAKSETAYVGLLGALYAGATPVPLGTETPYERMLGMVVAAEVDTIVTEPQRAATAEKLCSSVGARHVVLGDARWLRTALDEPDPAASQSEPAASESGAGGEDLAYILFTSGSTGTPKGVPISHANISAFLEASLPRYDLSPADRFSQLYEPTFDLAMFDLFMAWATGARVCALSRLHALDPVRCVRSLGLTVWHTTPSLAAAVLARGGLPPGSLPGLRYSIFCGEPLREHVADGWQRAASAGVLDNIYGPTELTIACTWFRRPASRRAARDEVVPIGVPNEGMTARLLLPDGRLVEPVDDAEGELCMSGPQRFAGYLDPQQDRDRFPVADGVRWYRTGDRVRVDSDAGLLHLGRIDSQVKIQGYRIELGEVELAISRVTGADAVVFATGDGTDTRLTAFVLASATRVASTETEAVPTVLRRLAAMLPPYMIPAGLWFEPDPPLNTSSKIDRPALRRLAAERLAARDSDRRVATEGRAA